MILQLLLSMGVVWKTGAIWLFLFQCIQLAPTVVKDLEDGVDPKEACSKLKLCTNQGNVRMVRNSINLRNISQKIFELINIKQYEITIISYSYE